MTGYQVAKVVNEMLTARGLKNIPAQMVYNYISKGLIKSYVANGQRLVSEDDASTWAEKYVGNKLAKVSS